MRRCIRPATASGFISVPGSRSISNRAMVAAALAEGESLLQGVPVCDDTDAMIGGLRTLGVEVRRSSDGVQIVGGEIGRVGAVVDAMSSGTTGRFLTAVACLAKTPAVIDGSGRLRERPIGPLIEALRDIGAHIEGDRLPIVAVKGALAGGRVQIETSASSQFVSAMALIAPAIEGSLTIEWEDLPSRPFVATTVEVMGAFGATARLSEGELVVPDSSRYDGSTVSIPPDAASAVYPALAAAITGGTVKVTRLLPTPLQADLAVFDVLESMGCQVDWEASGVRVHGPERLRHVSVDMREAPDGALAVVIAAAFADGPSVIDGLGTLAVKESDRLAGLAAGLGAIGAGVRVDDTSMTITPGHLHGGTVDANDDHRMAMAFSVAGLAVNGVCVDGAEAVTKTWPRFYEDMSQVAGRNWAK